MALKNWLRVFGLCYKLFESAQGDSAEFGSFFMTSLRLAVHTSEFFAQVLSRGGPRSPLGRTNDDAYSRTSLLEAKPV